MNHLRIGLAGLGHGGTLLGANQPQNGHLPLRVTALCDTDPEKLENTAATYGITSTTNEFAELVARTDIDIVGIYTPGPFHAAQILAALDAGKHVMVTKSMVYTMAEAEQVVEAVERTGRVLLVTQTMRGRYDFIAAKSACDAGELGELFMAEAHYIHDLRPVYENTPWRLQMPQDLILGGACHPIDLLRWFMGDIDEVHCYGLRSGIAPDYPQEDNFVINVRFKSGKIGRVANFLGLVHPPDVPMIGLSLYGTRGSIVDHQKRLDSTTFLPQHTFSACFPDARGHQGEMMVMLQHMANCILQGEQPWIGAREGAQIVATGLACWESLRSGLPAKVCNEF